MLGVGYVDTREKVRSLWLKSRGGYVCFLVIVDWEVKLIDSIVGKVFVEGK